MDRDGWWLDPWDGLVDLPTEAEPVPEQLHPRPPSGAAPSSPGEEDRPPSQCSDVADRRAEIRAALVETCQRYGLVAGRLAAQADEEAEAALQVATAAELECSPLVMEVFSELVQEAVHLLPLQERLRGSCGGPHREPLEDCLAVGVAAPRPPAEVIPLPRPGARVYRGSRFARKVAATAAEQQGRAEAEEKERGRWVHLLQKLFRESNVPSIAMAERCLDPGRAMAGLAGKTRLGTLRSYLRIWQGLRRWLLRTHGVPWPTSGEQVIDYLRALRRPCGPSVPNSVLRALAWVEKAAGIEHSYRLCERPDPLKAVDTAALEVSQGKPTTRRAPRFPVAILAALEVAVSDRALPTYLRGVAWLRLGEHSASTTRAGSRRPVSTSGTGP